jgi:CheY-like chemotaxis protein
MAETNRTGPRERPLVLLVDDDPHDREIYGTVLLYNGFDVMFAADAASGLAAATAHLPDLILLDLGLPDLDGVELCATLREQPGTAATPIVVLTGFRREERGWPAHLAGSTQFLEKPASPVDVLHTVEGLVGKAPLSGVGELPRIIDAGSVTAQPGSAGAQPAARQSGPDEAASAAETAAEADGSADGGADPEPAS